MQRSITSFVDKNQEPNKKSPGRFTGRWKGIRKPHWFFGLLVVLPIFGLSANSFLAAKMMKCHLHWESAGIASYDSSKKQLVFDTCFFLSA